MVLRIVNAERSAVTQTLRRMESRYRDIFEKLYAGDRKIAIHRGLWAIALGTLGNMAFYGIAAPSGWGAVMRSRAGPR